MEGEGAGAIIRARFRKQHDRWAGGEGRGRDCVVFFMEVRAGPATTANHRHLLHPWSPNIGAALQKNQISRSTCLSPTPSVSLSQSLSLPNAISLSLSSSLSLPLFLYSSLSLYPSLSISISLPLSPSLLPMALFMSVGTIRVEPRVAWKQPTAAANHSSSSLCLSTSAVWYTQDQKFCGRQPDIPVSLLGRTGQCATMNAVHIYS